MTIPIPSPPALPFLGNIKDMDPANGLRDLMRLADTYGEIFSLNLGGQTRVFVSSHAMLDELCNEKQWQKVVSAALKELRSASGDGLFTAFNDEHNWAVAHRVLMPAFGPLKMRDMFDEMHDIASQLVIKFARFGTTEKINVTDAFTRLTLDSIALCAMGFRFNSFYKENMHPFVDAMTDVLSEASPRASRLGIANYFMRSANQKWEFDANFMRDAAAEMLTDRLKNPTDKPDLLNAMILGRDPKTGEGLSETSIINNMVTFLIAGHETTSGLLSFLFYFLIKNPAVYQTAQKEVDKVVGRGSVTVEHMSQLPYLTACLRETLRLKPTAPAFTLTPRTDGPVLLGGKYEIEPGTPVMAILEKIHSDPAVWGEDADEFKPERMLDEPFSKLPKNAWKPFGNGMRGCIGRPFAWQESLLVTTLLLQNFNFRFDEPGYLLATSQTLTIKPKDFFMHASLREGLDVVHIEKQLHIDSLQEEKRAEHHENGDTSRANKVKAPMSILYGSNSGTCEALARSLGRTATTRGFQVNIDPLDAAVNAIPKGQPVVIITASYEGHPTDNAAHFVEWLSGLKGNELNGVNYAVYGCGNRDWISTFHKVPKDIDDAFSANGAKRITETGLGDVAAGDVFNDFDVWEDKFLWPALGGDGGDIETGFDVEIDTTSRPSSLRQDVKEAIVLNNESLTSGSEAEKRHITLKLPTGVSYRVGDYIAILPLNHSSTVHRVFKRFGLPWDSMLTIKSNTTLPSHPISASDILSAYVELSQPATRKYVTRISASIADEEARKEVLMLASDKFEAEIAAKRRSILDILEEYPSAQLPFGEFLAMLPPMRVRQYSISSSPLSDPTTATLTWSVLDTPSKIAGGKRFLGVASNYLSHLEAGDRVHVAIKPSHGNFHPPTTVETTPVIMICAGTGIAPFRGFCQERAMQIAAGRKLAPAFLFIGCAHPDHDLLFKSELEEWESIGAVKTFYAFSRAKEQSKGCKYVQDRIWEEREEMVKVFDEGAKLYVCGSSMVGEGVAHTIKRTYQEEAEARGKGKTEEEVQSWFESIKQDRFSSDVFT